jgi:hypothetical protein
MSITYQELFRSKATLAFNPDSIKYAYQFERK